MWVVLEGDVSVRRALWVMVACLILLSPSVVAKAPPKVPMVHELPEKASDAWYKIESDWTRETLGRCLKRYRIRLSCSDCSRAQGRFNLTVDAAGKLSAHKAVKQSVCGKAHPRLMRCFIHPLKAITFPPPLRKKTFQVLMGAALRC